MLQGAKVPSKQLADATPLGAGRRGLRASPVQGRAGAFESGLTKRLTFQASFKALDLVCTEVTARKPSRDRWTFWPSCPWTKSRRGFATEPKLRTGEPGSGGAEAKRVRPNHSPIKASEIRWQAFQS